MKTKNIFRMLLVAVALLLGANNIKADETFRLWTSPNGDAGTEMKDWTTINLGNSYLQSINEGDVVNFYGWVISTENQRSVGLYNNTNNSIVGELYAWQTDIFPNGVCSCTVTQNQADMFHNTPYIELRGQAVYVTRVEVIHKGGGTQTTTYSITIAPDIENGTVTVDGEMTGLHEGDEVRLTATPDDGFEFGEWNVTYGNNTVTVTNNKFTMPAGNVTVSATFNVAESETYSVTVNAGDNGSASVDKATASAGEIVTITTNPDSGYEVNAITGVNATKMGTNTYTFTMPSNNVTVNVTFKAITPAETVSAYISSSTGYTSFSSYKNLDFSTVSGLKAYIATYVSGDQVHLVQVRGVVPAGTGLILYGTSGTTTSIPVTTSDATLSETNLLQPGTGDALTLSTSYTDYVLVESDTAENGVAFAEVYDSNHLPTIALGKAYLRITNNGARKRSLSISFPNDHTTGISNIENETAGDNVVYNLRGQRVDNPTKGIYIINGKKVLFK